MANPVHLAKIHEGVKSWNSWRTLHPKIVPDLSGAVLTGSNLARIDLRRANLEGVIFSEADLRRANLASANLNGANLWRANLSGSDLRGAILSRTQLSQVNLSLADLRESELSTAYCRGADFSGADLRFASIDGAVFFQADLRRAKLSGAVLMGAVFIATDMRAANLEGCAVYGVSAWDLQLDGAIQRDLVVTPSGQAAVEVDDLEIAQFIYLLLNGQKIRRVIDTVRSKAVLILGRFTPDRKPVLDAIRRELRKHGYLPMLFDFEGPATQTTEETISTLGHMARFVIADLTDARSVLQELRAIVPNCPSVPVQPLCLASDNIPGMFDFFSQFPWVLKPVRYRNQKALIAGFSAKVIVPAETMSTALSARR